MIKIENILLILGMHRSGTSAVTQLVHLMGAEVGNNLLPGHTEINRKGFWENREIIDVHDEILAKLDSAWFDFRPLPKKWWLKDDIVPYHLKLIDILERDYSRYDLLVVKDPRICRMLPMWDIVLSNKARQIYCLIVIRHPEEVVGSLVKRDGFDPEFSAMLWLTYVFDAEYYSRGLPRAVVSYDAVLSNWMFEIKRISSEMDIRWPNSIEDVHTQISEALDPSLRHHHAITKSDEPEGIMMKLALDVYDTLSQGPNEDLTEFMDKKKDTLIDASEQMMDALASMAFRTTRVMTQKVNHYIKAMQEDNAAHLATVQDLTAQLNAHWSWRIGKRILRAVGMKK